MYLLLGILLPLLCLSCLVFHWRKKRIIQKIHNMCLEEKCTILEELIAPFGFSYVPSQDIFTSRIDAWQREFGYCTLYDETAHRFHLIFDALPVYFDYNGRTWLIEFWKGQYGINTGCEIGVYYTDRILPHEQRSSTLFQSVEDKEMLPLSLRLFKNGRKIAWMNAKHWWLTAFCLGRYSEKNTLGMRASLTFPNLTMAMAFAKGLLEAGCRPQDICRSCNTITFSFTSSSHSYSKWKAFRIGISRKKNRFWCSVYLFLTRPFCLSLDKILYLYYYLPFVFHRILRIRKYQRRRR